MIGSQAVGALIAHFAFWIVLVVGTFFGEVKKKWTVAFIVLYLFGYIGLPRIAEFGGLYVTSYVAVLDVALVFLVFKGDVRLS